MKPPHQLVTPAGETTQAEAATPTEDVALIKVATLVVGDEGGAAPGLQGPLPEAFLPWMLPPERWREAGTRAPLTPTTPALLTPLTHALHMYFTPSHMCTPSPRPHVYPLTPPTHVPPYPSHTCTTHILASPMLFLRAVVLLPYVVACWYCGEYFVVVLWTAGLLPSVTRPLNLFVAGDG